MVYLDNAATTKPKYFAWDWGSYWMNSNAPYALGEQARLSEARERIKSCLGVKGGQVLFCRSATEASEWLCSKQQLSTKCCSPYEHDSVYNVCLPYNVNLINELDLIDIYLHQYVNQMTGEIFDIEAIAKRLHKYDNGYAFFGVDLTASIGHAKLPVNLEEYCDALWASGHKHGAEKGIAFLWVSDRMFNFLGGNKDYRNEFDLLHGSVNVPSAISMSYAMSDTMRWYEELGEKHFNKLVDVLVSQLEFSSIEYKIVETKVRSKAINTVILYGIEADALQAYLAKRQIYIGVGHSACAIEADYRVLKNYNLSEEESRSAIRVSFSESTTEDDIKTLVENIKEFKERYYGSC